MDMETWFAPAIEMGRLVRQYRIAQEDEKEELERRIQNSAYISRLNTMQSFNSAGMRSFCAGSWAAMWFAPAIIPSPGISWMPATSWDCW